MARNLVRALVAATLCAFPFSASLAHAQAARRGVAAFERAQFERARQLLGAALEAEDLTREDALRAHQHLGAVQQILGDEAASRAHALAAIALDPSVSAPAGAPAFAEVLRAARAEQGEMAALRIVTTEEQVPALRDTRVVARLSPSPPGLVDTLALRCAVGRESLERTGPPPEVEVLINPPETATSVRCQSEGRTEAGAALFVASRDLEVVMPGDEPWLWVALGAGGGAVIAGVLVAVLVVTLGASDNDARLNEPTVPGWP